MVAAVAGAVVGRDREDERNGLDDIREEVEAEGLEFRGGKKEGGVERTYAAAGPEKRAELIWLALLFPRIETVT